MNKHRAFIFVFFSLLCAAFLIVSCSKDDDSPTEPTNSAPVDPFNPSPADSTIDQSIDVNLSWSCSDPDGDPLTFDVYFGTLEDPPLASERQLDTTYNPDELEYSQTYYWKIVTEDSRGNPTEGDIWQFTTRLSGGGGEEGDYPGEERDFNLTDEVTMTMVWIPAGSYEMGAYEDEQAADDDEYPQHEVNINYGFWMGKYEVTQAQWEAVTGNNRARNYGVGDDHPVYYVSWNDIHEDFLSQIDDDFRLPSESEWEYACRAGTETRFYWGDDPDYDEIGDYAVYRDNDPNGTAEVGTKRPNAFGLYDMSGNVYEWCEDYYHDNYTGAPNNGSAWTSPSTSYRVLRGGSWIGYPRYCRCAYRCRSDPYESNYFIGFRVVFR